MKYSHGDVVKYTGKSHMEHDAMVYEYELLEGHKIGDKIYSYHIPNVEICTCWICKPMKGENNGT